MELSIKKINFSYGIRPMYYFSRTVGLWPFSIISNSNGMIRRAQIGVCDIMWFLISICLFIWAIFIFFDQTYLRDKRFGSVTLVGFLVFQTMSLGFGMFAIILDLFNRNKLIGILQQFTKFDKQVSCYFFELFN